MADPIQDSNPNRPYTIADLKDDTNYLPIPTDTLQLQVDCLNVIENRVPIENFTPDYQQQILNYYRFSATRANSNVPTIAKRTTDTFEII